MKCEFCGEQYKEEDKFCKKCGSQISKPKVRVDKENNQPKENVDEENSQPKEKYDEENNEPKESVDEENNQPKIKDEENNQVEEEISKKLKINIEPKKLLMLLPAAIILLLAFILIPKAFKTSNYVVRNKNISFLVSDDNTVISVDAKGKYNFDEEIYSNIVSADGSTAAVITGYNYSNGGILWSINASGKNEIADDILGFVISANGTTIAYVNNENTLYLYDTKSKKSTKVSDDVFASDTTLVGVCLSPDGKTVTYIKDFKEENYNIEFTGYVKVGSKSPEKLGDNIMCIAVADKAKYIYYVELGESGDDGSFYVKKGKNKIKLGSDLDAFSYDNIFAFNSDYSQLVFNYNGRSYISRNGKDKVKISNSRFIDFITPSFNQTVYDENRRGYLAYGIKDFANTLCVTDEGKIVYINKKYETQSVSSRHDYYDAIMTVDGKKILYKSGDKLYRRAVANEEAKDVEITKNVAEFTASPDGVHVYYINYDDELWYVKNNSKPKKISDDVSHIEMSNDGKTLFFLNDYSSNSGTLYFTKNGGKKTKVKQADDVMGMLVTPTAVYYYADYSSDGYFDVFRSNGNEKFTKLQETVSYIK